MEKVDYVDITPKALEPTAGKRHASSLILQEGQWQVIKENPGLLTDEGCQQKVALWKRSQNKHVLGMYQTMLARCKNFVESGKTKSGHIIYSRFPDGTERWVESDLEKRKRESLAEKPKKKS
jgi:hypothetical protein|tara:strand:- start:982 stop:1347 length:366 start_codon:yes stop_codon:yes gene_type:complete